jgi:hypothetical protein
MARLVIFDDRVRAVELPQRQILIGRSKKNDVPINDRLLSRKHCSIVPLAGGYRLLDLKSSNGTYLNGERIEKIDLTVDDIVEIGQTVMVFLEDGVWSRGEALARLRNPIKAQELIGRIKRHERAEDGAVPDKEARIPIGKVASRPTQGPGKSRKLRRVKRPVAAPAPAAALPGPDLLDAMEDFIVHRAVLILLKSSPNLRRAVAEVLREALRPRDAGAASLATPSAAPLATPSAVPLATPSAASSATPSAVPLATPSAASSATPSAAPLATPSAAPLATPSAAPLATPSAASLATPSAASLATPSAASSATPSAASLATPSAAPSAASSAASSGLRSRVREGLRKKFSRSAPVVQAPAEAPGKAAGDCLAAETVDRPEIAAEASEGQTPTGEADHRSDGDGGER